MLKKITAFAMSVCMAFSLAACGNNDAEKMGDYLTGKDCESTAGIRMELEDDGNFKFFRSKDDTEDNYYSGTFVVRSGQEAIDFLEETYQLPEESQRTAMQSFSVDEKNYYALTLTNKECIEGGVNTLAQDNDVTYYGYYDADYEYLNLYSLKTMTQYEFYKK